MKKYLYIFVAILLSNSCTRDYMQLHEMSFSTVTFVTNTLDYPVLVQCYFRPFNDNNFWCENELIEYSEPIEILPNEYKVVMDYVMPLGIKVFKSGDNTLLFENFNNGIVWSSNDALSYSSEEEKKLGTVEGKKIIPKSLQKVAMYSVKDDYFLKNERYLYKNVPWSLYPIMFENNRCYENLIQEYDEYRKTVYKELTDGYALVKCIVFNKNAACFKP